MATVFITGASSGIGAACAEIFAQNNYQLILAARRKHRLEELVERLAKKSTVAAHIIELDVRDAVAVQQSLQTLPAQFKQIDVLINNAGLAAGLEKIQEGLLENWEQMIDTNIKGLLYVTRAILPAMVQRNQGHIINIGSIAGHECYPGGNVYAATKHAVLALTYGMRIDLMNTKIRVTSVDPGMVETEFSEVRFKGDKQRAAAVYQNMQPLTPQDVADAIYYCASRPAHVNIQDIIIMPTDQASTNHVSRYKE